MGSTPRRARSGLIKLAKGVFGVGALMVLLAMTSTAVAEYRHEVGSVGVLVCLLSFGLIATQGGWRDPR